MRITCPDCQRPIPFDGDVPPSELRCTSCGTVLVQASGEAVTITSDESNETVTYLRSTGLGSAEAAVMAMGKRLGDYELLEEIARGGMGVVFKARQASLNRVVALKMIKAGDLAGEGDIQRFRAEAEASANLDHPNIVPIYEVGEHAGRQFFSMGYVEGRSLQDQLAEGPIPPRDAAKLIRTITLAVQFAHDKGIVHRDLKPANVLMDANGQPKITDFGLAKTIGADSGMTATGQIMGTPSYMPPEQAAGNIDEIGPLSDVYSLGAMLYATLTGHPPFQAANAVETLKQVVEREPVSPAQVNPGVHRDVETICLKCLEKDPAKRYRSAAELAEDLRRYINHEPITARPLGRLERIWRWCRRNPAVAGLTAAVYLVFIVGLTLTTWKWADAEREHRNAVDARNDADREAVAARQNERAAENARRLAEDNLLAARENLYVAYVNWARSVWDDGLSAFAQELLEACRPGAGQKDLRGFEWFYLKRICRVPVFEQTVFQFATSAAIHPDGEILAVVNRNTSVSLWSLTTKRHLRALVGHRDLVVQVLFSPDGRTLLSASKDGTVKLWDVGSGKTRHTLQGHRGPVSGAAFSDDGKRIASIGSQETRIWDAKSGKLLKTLPGGGKGIDFTPDGENVVTAAAAAVRVRNVESGEDTRRLSIHVGLPLCVAVSRDGRWIAAGGSAGVQVWNAKTGQEFTRLAVGMVRVTSIAFSPDGRRIATFANDAAVRLWDVASGWEQYKFFWQFNNPGSVAFNSDGTRIVGTSGSVVKVWDAPREDSAAVLEKGAPRPSRESFRTNFAGVAFSPDGTRLASAAADKEITIRDVATRKILHTLRGHDGVVQCVAYSPDGERLASAGSDKVIIVWNVRTGEIVRKLVGHAGEVTCVAYNSSGTRIVSASSDKTMKLWDAGSGKEIRNFTGSVSAVFHVVFSPEGRRIISGDHTRVRFWDVETGAELKNLESGVLKYCGVAFSPDGKQMAIADRFKIRLCDAATGDTRRVLSGHVGYVKSLAYSRDGKRLVSAGMDKTVRVWNPATGAQLLTLIGHSQSIDSVAISADGHVIASASVEGTVVLWNGRPLE